jgi:predicted transcriptional regulator
MMSQRIEVPNDLYEQLHQRAVQIQRSPDQLATEALRRYLNATAQPWEQRLQQVLTSQHARPDHPLPAEIEADITAAAAEARELRRERRRAD